MHHYGNRTRRLGHHKLPTFRSRGDGFLLPIDQYPLWLHCNAIHRHPTELPAVLQLGLSWNLHPTDTGSIPSSLPNLIVHNLQPIRCLYLPTFHVVLHRERNLLNYLSYVYVNIIRVLALPNRNAILIIWGFTKNFPFNKNGNLILRTPVREDTLTNII